MKSECLVCLGRIGDIINALPIAYDMAKKMKRPTPFVVSAEFASVLDGCSYVEPLVYPGSYRQVRDAHDFAKLSGYEPRVAQWYGWTQEKTESNFQREAWKLAGYEAKWGTLPTVFDRRSDEREFMLYAKHVEEGQSCKWIAVCDTSHSSPFKIGPKLDYALGLEFPYHAIIDISSVKADRYFDILGVLDRCECLVTVDTAALHLARASKCPTVAIVNDRDGGWWASEAPPQAVHTAKYSEGEGMITNIVAAIHRFVIHRHAVIWHAYDPFGDSPRHARAQQTFSALRHSSTAWFNERVYKDRNPRSAKDIGDSRDLPFFKDIIDWVIAEKMEPHDIILFGNSDGGLRMDTCEVLRKYVPSFGAVAMRRDNDHIGAEAFAFTRQWFEQYRSEIPDFFQGAPCWDIALRAFIRLQRGIVTTPSNLAYDFAPCDLTERIILHEDHPSEWVKHEHSPANLHNRRLARQWLNKLGLTELARMFS